MSARRGHRTVEVRLRRLLVMLPWLMERGEAPIAEVAERFGLTEAEVTADLELASMCGLPPFVDELVDVWIDDDTVHVGVPRLFTRPLRLNSPEAFELLVAGRAALELPGADPTGPLARGLRKLAAALGEDGDATAGGGGAGGNEVAGVEVGGVEVDLAPPDDAADLVRAIDASERLAIRYWSAARDEVTEREIVPRRLFADRGNWYVAAWDSASDEQRTFRLDRIESLAATGETDPAHGRGSDVPLPVPGDWFGEPGVTRAVLRLRPAAHWVVERYPVDDVDGPDAEGVLTVRLPVASERWIARLLVRLGPHAEVVEPAALRDAGVAAAERVLARYRRS